MTRPRGGKGEPNRGRTRSESSEVPRGAAPFDDAQFAMPELVRRAITLGLSGLFVTQETLRQAVGDALPKEWVDFASEQSERTRTEFIDRLAGEVARVVETSNLAELVESVLEDRTIEVNAKIRLAPRRSDSEGDEVRFSVIREKKK